METAMFELLISGGDFAAPREFDQFGQLIGSWEIDAEFYEADGSATKTTAEWHFALILGGRAIQDVLVFPGRNAGATSESSRIGTSIRFYDAAARLWRVVWISPDFGTMYKLEGRQQGDRIVLNGDPHDGEPTRWIFEDITTESFTWRGFVHDGSEWRLIQLMLAHRDHG